MLSLLSDAEIREALLEMTSSLIADKDDEWRARTTRQLLGVFEEWKVEHGTRAPKTHRGGTGLSQLRTISFADAAPYDCSDDSGGVGDYVALCLILLSNKYEPFMTLVTREQFSNVLMVAAMIERETMCVGSLVTALKIAFDAAIFLRNSVSEERNMLRLLAAA